MEKMIFTAEENSFIVEAEGKKQFDCAKRLTNWLNNLPTEITSLNYI